MSQQVIEATPIAIVRQVSTRWGQGRSQCLLCGSEFRYSLMPDATVAHVSAGALCDQLDCTGDGTHRGGCHALGGDLCPNCDETVRVHPESIPGLLAAQVRGLAERQAKLMAYAGIPWEVDGPPPF